MLSCALYSADTPSNYIQLSVPRRHSPRVFPISIPVGGLDTIDIPSFQRTPRDNETWRARSERGVSGADTRFIPPRLSPFPFCRASPAHPPDSVWGEFIVAVT